MVGKTCAKASEKTIVVMAKKASANVGASSPVLKAFHCTPEMPPGAS